MLNAAATLHRLAESAHDGFWSGVAEDAPIDNH